MKQHDLTTVSLGAGLQSSLICEMVIAGELPRPDAVIFADTGDEPQHVYQQVTALKAKLETVNVPLIVTNNGNMVDDIYSNGRFVALPLFTRQSTPVSGFGMETDRVQVGRLRRQCTSEYKIRPIERVLRQLLLSRGLADQRKNGIYVKHGVSVETWLGITLDEVERMKPSRTKWITNRWPLVEQRMTRSDCERWYTERGLPAPPKSSCIRCPFHDDAYWRQMRDERSDDWNTVVAFDSDLRSGNLRLAATVKGDVYLHRQCVPLEEVDLEPKNNGQAMFEFCDEGFCWT